MFEKETQFNKQKPKAELPIGEAKKIAEITQKKWQEHFLLFSKVKNKVFEINPAFKGTLPLKLEEGKPSPLGLFAEMELREKPDNPPQDKQALEFWGVHGRSIILRGVIFRDKEGRLY